MKRVCLIKYDMSVAGGGERVTSVLANELSKIYKVFVISIVEQHGKCFYSFCDDVTYHVLLDSKKRMKYQLVQGIFKLRNYFLTNKIDVAISVGVGISLFLIGASAYTKVKTVVCEHSSLSNKFNNNINQNICRWFGVKYADKIITLTNADRDLYIKKYGLNEERIDFIHNFIECKLSDKKIVYSEKSRIILSVGRFDRVKGYGMLIKVAKKIYPEFPKWQWHIYGDGDSKYMEEIQSLILENHLSNFITLKGICNNIYPIYQSAGVLVLTSYYEGLPMVLLEAKVNQLPIVSFDCMTGPSEIIEDGISGFLIDCYNTELMAEKINLLIRDNELRSKFSQHAKDNLDKFNKKIILNKWIKLIDYI